MKDIEFTCKHCGHELVCEVSGAGQIVPCPECGQRVTVPTVSTPEMNKEAPKKTFKVNRGVAESHTPSSSPQQHQQSNGNSSQTPITIILVLLLVGVLLSGLSFLQISPRPKFEYTHITFLAGSHKRTGTDALMYSSIKIDQAVLNRMGGDGWEMVGSYLEMETAFPNLGTGEYVTGLQPNIRPQCLVVIFKRRI
jgi:uncharacterized Zn finger protein (UPF0148 family)